MKMIQKGIQNEDCEVVSAVRARQIRSNGDPEEGPVLPKMEEDETKREISWRR